MTDLALSIAVYHGTHAGIFSDYDWAPSLVEFHGVKMYGKVRQEAHADLKKLQVDRFFENLAYVTGRGERRRGPPQRVARSRRSLAR